MKKNYCKRNRVSAVAFVLAALFILFRAKTVLAQAQGIVPCGSPGQQECTLCHLVIGFQNIMTFFMSVLFIATMFFITLAGVIYMVSSGNKALMDWAKKALTYSLTGFAIFLCSWLIVTAILTALGYQQVGSWWSFSCDTTPASSTGASLPKAM